VSSFTARVAAALVTTAITLLSSSCGHSPAGGPAHTSTHADEPVITGEPAAYNADDFAFANNMIPADQQAIEMSQRVPDHSSNSQLVALATQDASARQSDVLILKALRAQWRGGQDDQTGGDGAGVTPKPPIDAATIAKLDTLHGNAFDTLWLKSMISLDQGSIEMATTEISKGKNADAIGLAKQIIAAMQADSAQMQKLLAA
jgi:uncharacterized protein (DUF305 family)